MYAQLNRTCLARRLLSLMNGIPAIHPWENAYEV
jgi:hypothetical protein